MNPLRAAIGHRLLASDPLVACARYDCRNTDPETHYDHGSGRMPTHDHQPPSATRIAIRAGYRWAVGRRRLREDLAATRVQLDELRYSIKATECTPALPTYGEVVAAAIPGYAQHRQATAGLDDQDGHATRARQLAVPNAEGWATVYANQGDRWWAVGPDGSWLPVPGVPDTSGAKPLGWVEIPHRTADAPAASEEQASA